MSTYAEFLAAKRRAVPAAGIDCTPVDLDPRLFDFQAHVTAWAVRRGRAAIWMDTGLGKTAVQVEWARRLAERTGVRPLILAPLAVAEQTVRMAADLLDVPVTYAADQAAADTAGGIVISNYDRLHLLDPAAYGAVVLDESSVIKDVTTKTRDHLLAVGYLRGLRAAYAACEERVRVAVPELPWDSDELSRAVGVEPPGEGERHTAMGDARWALRLYDTITGGSGDGDG